MMRSCCSIALVSTRGPVTPTFGGHACDLSTPMALVLLIMTCLAPVQTAGLQHTAPEAELARPGYSRGVPRFDDYKVRAPHKGAATWLAVGRCDQADYPGGVGYDRLIRVEARKNGPNFAGRCVVVVCSCGTECGNLSIVDLRTGHIYSLPFVLAVNRQCPRQPATMRYDIYIRRDSSLLIVVGNLVAYEKAGAVERYQGCAVRYYRWTARKLVLIHKTPI